MGLDRDLTINLLNEEDRINRERTGEKIQGIIMHPVIFYQMMNDPEVSAHIIVHPNGNETFHGLSIALDPRVEEWMFILKGSKKTEASLNHDFERNWNQLSDETKERMHRNVGLKHNLFNVNNIS